MSLRVRNNINTEGTFLLGYLPEGITFNDVVAVLGDPNLNRSADGKTRAEWHGLIDDRVFSVYDYKSEIPPEKNTNWHVGGLGKTTYYLLLRYFEEEGAK